MRPSQVAVSVSRLGLLLALSLLLFLSSYARLSGSFPPAGVFLYGAHLSLLASLTLFAFWTLLEIIERHTRRGRAFSTLLALGLVFPLIYYVAAHVASGDGLRARGVPEALSTTIGCVSLSALAMIVWSYRFWAQRRAVDVLVALLAVAFLLVCEAHLSRAQTQLATLLQLFAVFLATQLVLLIGGEGSRGLFRAGLGFTAATASLALLGFATPLLRESGRRRALVAESSTAYVDARLLGTSRSRTPPKLARTHCRALEERRTFPALALAAEQRRNVILVSIDTLRADHARLRLNGELLMPELDRFAQEARYAPAAQSAFPATLLSMTAALTGNMPSDVLLAPKPLANLFTRTRGKLDVVEAVLPKGKYFTRPDVQAYLLSGAEVQPIGSARQEVGYATWRLRELRAQGKSHLMWIHFFEPHSPYEQQTETIYGSDDLGRYRSELALVDGYLGQLLQFLREGGWYDDSLIMVFADHGESFGEHGHYFHHYLVYPWLVNVPLLWRAPGTVSGQVDAPVHLMDVTPTVLHFLGMDATGPMRGVSLLASEPPATRPLLSEEISISGRMMLQYRTSPAKNLDELYARLWRLENGPGYASKLGVRAGDRYLVQHRASQANELFAWRSDKLAAHDLADLERDTARRINAQAERFRESVLTRAFCALPAQ